MSSSPAQTWYGKVNEDGSYTLLARVASLSGTGTQVRPREGYCLAQMDIDSIGCTVFNLGTNKNNPSGTTVTPAPTVTAEDNIYDVLQTDGWEQDTDGYNFRLDLGPQYAPEANNWYLIEVKFTQTDGTVAWLVVKVQTTSLQTS